MYNGEAEFAYSEYVHTAESEQPVTLTNQITPYDNWTLDDLFREFGSSDRPEVIELVRRCAMIHYQKVAFFMLHESMSDQLEDMQKDLDNTTNEDGLTMGDLDDLVGEHRATIHRLTTELEAMTKKFNRAQSRSDLWKKKLTEAKKQLKYETRSVDRLETRTRRKINV